MSLLKDLFTVDIDSFEQLSRTRAALGEEHELQRIAIRECARTLSAMEHEYDLREAVLQVMDDQLEMMRTAGARDGVDAPPIKGNGAAQTNGPAKADNGRHIEEQVPGEQHLTTASAVAVKTEPNGAGEHRVRRSPSRWALIKRAALPSGVDPTGRKMEILRFAVTRRTGECFSIQEAVEPLGEAGSYNNVERLLHRMTQRNGLLVQSSRGRYRLPTPQEVQEDPERFQMLLGVCEEVAARR